MRFAKVSDIIERMNQWLITIPKVNIFNELKREDTKRTGILSHFIFYKILERNSIKLTEDDKKMIEK